METAAKGPREFDTNRLTLRAPLLSDAEAIFDRYAGDPDVARYLSWPRHRSVADTRSFLEFSALEWERWPAGPYLIRSRADGRLLGGTGLAFESTREAMTGYVLAKDAWGQGYATEALEAMVDLSTRLGLVRLYALCHPEHRASQRVLEKCGFSRNDTWAQPTPFPNLSDEPQATVCYELRFAATRP